MVPKLYDMDNKAIVDEIMELAKVYIPEWNTDSKDSLYTLVELFAYMHEGTLKRMNGVLENYNLHSLNLSGEKNLPALSARVPLQFIPSKGIEKSIWIDKAVKVFSKEKGADDQPIVFETNQALSVISADINGLFSVRGDDKKVFSHDEILSKKPQRLFNSSGPQEHYIYIGDESMNLRGNFNIELSFFLKKSSLLNMLNDKKNIRINGSIESYLENITWEFFDGNSWRPLKWEVKGVELPAISKRPKISIHKEDNNSLIRQDNSLKIKGILGCEESSQVSSINEIEINGKKGMFIRGAVKHEYLRENIDFLSAKYSKIEIRTSIKSENALTPEYMFSNDIDITSDRKIWPFGKKPNVQNCFYIGDSGVFSQFNSRVSIVIGNYNHNNESNRNSLKSIQGIGELFEKQLNKNGIYTIEDLEKCSPKELTKYLYYNHKGVKIYITENTAKNILYSAKNRVYDLFKGKLRNQKTHEKIYEPNLILPTNEIIAEYFNGDGWRKIVGGDYTLEDFHGDNCISFLCPKDIKKTKINGHESYWFRFRLIRYEQSIEHSMAKSLESVISCDSIKIGFVHENVKRPQEIIKYNQLNYHSWEPEEESENSFELFHIINDLDNTVYISFDSDVGIGPISLFFDIDEQKMEGILPINYTWYGYFESDKSQFKIISVVDDTMGFTRSGNITVVIDEKMQKTKIFDKEGFYIKGVCNKSTESNIYPVIKAVYKNTVWGQQAERVEKEYPILADSPGEITYKLNKKPIVDEEVWVNEVNILSAIEIKELIESNRKDVKIVKNKEGIVEECSIRWTKVDFIHTNGNGREYALDRSKGILTFSPYIKSVMALTTNCIEVSYSVTQGEIGNIRGESIVGASSSIPYIDKIINPLPAFGGVDVENMHDLLKRFSHQIKSKKMIVTKEDYEAMLYESNLRLARVRCIPNYRVGADKLYSKYGSVTMIIIPKSGEERPYPSSELLRKAKEYVNARVSGSVGDGNLFIIGPKYISLSVNMEAYTTDISDMSLVRERVNQALNDYLNPLSGDYGKGWNFGRTPHLSDFYGLIEGIDGVDHVGNLEVVIMDSLNGNVLEKIKSDDKTYFPQSPEYIVSGGSHEITVKYQPR